MFELALVVAAAASAYAAWASARRRRLGLATALLGSALGAGVAAALDPSSSEGTGLLGAIALGVATCLLVIGPAVRGLGRAAMLAERYTLARRLLAVADLLQPGAGVREDLAGLAALVQVRAGDVGSVVDAIRRARAQAPRAHHRAFDERIAMLYLVADRADDALAQVRTYLEADAAASAAPSAAAANDASPEPAAPGLAELPLSPALWVELLELHARRGELARAIAMSVRLDHALAGHPGEYGLRHHARIALLAWSGRRADLASLLAPASARHLSASARHYWLGVAHARAGEPDAAQVAWTLAARRARHRLLRHLRQLQAAPPDAAMLDAELGAALDRALAPSLPPVPPRPARRGALAAILLLLVAWPIVSAATLGALGDPGVQLRAGAAVRSAVAAGEWWRLVTATFVQVGALHVLASIAAVWIVGRWVQALLGPAVTWLAFLLGGVAGTATSVLASDVGAPLGPSAAVMGLVGALLVELALRRRAHAGAWRGGVGTSLLVVTSLHVGLGMLLPTLHGAGDGVALIVGALVGSALSPAGRARVVRTTAGRALGLATAAIALGCGALVATTSVRTTVGRAGIAPVQLGDLVTLAPSTWRVVDGELGDPDLYVRLLVTRTIGPPAAVLTELRQAELEQTKARGFERSWDAGAELALPAGVLQHQRVATLDDALDARIDYRVVLAAVPLDATTSAAVLAYLPASLVDALAPTLAAVINAIAVAPPPPPLR